MSKWKQQTEYIFFRDEMFYMAPCKDDDEARECAELNVGTRRVERLTGEHVWPLKPRAVN